MGQAFEQLIPQLGPFVVEPACSALGPAAESDDHSVVANQADRLVERVRRRMASPSQTIAAVERALASTQELPVAETRVQCGAAELLVIGSTMWWTFSSPTIQARTAVLELARPPWWIATT